MQGDAFYSDQFATFALGVYTSEEGNESSSQMTRRGRQIKPSQKVQEMQWNIVRGRGKRGKGARSRGHGPPS